MQKYTTILKAKPLQIVFFLLFINSLQLFAQNTYNWYCPDNKLFPPVSLKLWHKVPAINGRLPTYMETINGTALMYYDIKKMPDAKCYNMTLPKLACFIDPNTKKHETVIVIQITQTAKDTIVGYRYLSGGNGTYGFKHFHFLTGNEVKKMVEQ